MLAQETQNMSRLVFIEQWQDQQTIEAHVNRHDTDAGWRIYADGIG